MPKKYLPVAAGLILLIIAGVFAKAVFLKPKTPGPVPTPSPLPAAEQLPDDKKPSVSLLFSNDLHFVTVNITNIYSEQLEYNLIYDALVKNNRIQTGVNAAAKLDGKTEYTQKQLLGSESSGKFTYHEDIQNAVLELTLRDSENRSVFTAAYPFSPSAGQSIEL
ncbi:MAG: hypothetical protein UX91_C0009G0022 [Candidatus Amesbacteria bacterium GW2011_GWB1_47_19]|nr:MAG: hypothetical protein UW51_C0008G0024 [Candidatus Amesbacteria bacterium GW2011_GWA1_44_24]KKU30953.1 MAG: hypothetical protein UX46_C0009G0029 [Candidatus Amesbacteria bacterium GW2011_GWC1_46_24]KKU66616.1 MAG: hypothetical protein UX91_C0009G0022 [Candidatus Amesbacteria bacterium GW2011_GWB1_47_19]OGD05337.1 MAG: hypothetical protein A2379_01275 [Candidatus Amesbacteria bacterium RIFOXYB1_FULL_47_13]HBC73208.1 hypothetical protein [Candidatus Amesbacteria bacterium]